MKNEKENCRIEAGSQAENQMTSVNKAKSEGRFFFYVLTFRPPLAFMCSWDKRLTPCCGSTALCQAQGPVRVSSLILQVYHLLVVQPVLVSFTFSLFPNTKTISVWLCSSFSHLQVTLAQALCHPSSLGSERSPHPLLTVSLMLPRFIASVSVASSRN